MHAVTIIITEGGMGFGHISILLSEPEGKKFKVSHKYGYYAVPSTSDPNSLIGKIKKKRNIDLDLTGNHGMLIDEEMHWLDKGSGVHGVTIEIYPEQFTALYQKCEKKKKNQYLAIDEAVEILDIIDPQLKYKYYPQEKYSYQIFQREQQRAREKSEESRLYPFGVKLSLSLDGLFKNSSNCKTGALDIMTGIIPPEHLKRLTENGAYPVRPGRSGPMEEILFHSSGPWSTRTTKHGIKKFRKNSAETSLYWTIPPQELIRLPLSSFPPPIDKELCLKMKSVAKKLQALERIILNSTLDDLKIKKSTLSLDQIESAREYLITKIVHCYEVFSIIEDKPKEPRNAGLFANKDIAPTRVNHNLLEAENVMKNLYLILTNTKQPTSAGEPETFLNFISTKDIEKMLSTISYGHARPILARL